MSRLMDAHEIAERVTAANRAIAAQGRIDWYGRVVPGWWKQLREVFEDRCWEDGDLNEFCFRVFGCGEGEMKAFMQGAWRDYRPKPEVQVFTSDFSNIAGPVSGPARQEAIKVQKKVEQELKKAMTPAERARAYRERKKAKP